MEANSSGILPNIEYPPPPRVHWAVLLLAFIALAILIAWLAPEPYQNLLNSLVFDSWVFYLCIWIRSMDADARSPFWCDVYIVVELSCAAMTIYPSSSGLYIVIGAILQIASVVLGIATVYLIRADLLKHYNEREPIGLYLGGVQTWFFSFLYFQSQLYPIAQLKRSQAENLTWTA